MTRSLTRRQNYNKQHTVKASQSNEWHLSKGLIKVDLDEFEKDPELSRRNRDSN